MIVIRTAEDMARAMNSPLPPELKQLLHLRRDQLLADAGDAYELSELAQFNVLGQRMQFGNVSASPPPGRHQWRRVLTSVSRGRKTI
jgi:hypothetical protein